MSKEIGFQPGEVVVCYEGTPQEASGVVRTFEPANGRYRVRVSTDPFVELGVKRADMRRKGPEAALDWL